MYCMSSTLKKVKMDSTKSSLKISVVLVTYNRAPMLNDVLTSLTVQSRQPDEVVVVDNCSTDETRKVIESFGKKLNIKYVYEDQQGIPFARNAGVRNASGDILVFTDDDCVAEWDWLHYLVLPFLRDPGIGMVGGEILTCQVTNSIIEKFCIADSMMRVGFLEKKRGSRS